MIRCPLDELKGGLIYKRATCRLRQILDGRGDPGGVSDRIEWTEM